MISAIAKQDIGCYKAVEILKTMDKKFKYLT